MARHEVNEPKQKCDGTDERQSFLFSQPSWGPMACVSLFSKFGPCATKGNAHKLLVPNLPRLLERAGSRDLYSDGSNDTIAAAIRRTARERTEAFLQAKPGIPRSTMSWRWTCPCYDALDPHPGPGDLLMKSQRGA